MSTAKKQSHSDRDENGHAKRPTGISAEGQKWLEENAEAIKSMNEWVEKNGLPLEKYRMF